MTTHSNYLDTERRAADAMLTSCPFCGHEGAHEVLRETARCDACDGLWIWDRTAMDAYVNLVDVAETYRGWADYGSPLTPGEYGPRGAAARDLADWHEAAACAVLAYIDTDADADA